MMNQAHLTWHGPFTFRALLTDESLLTRFQLPGVYLWVDRKRTQLWYVGRSLTNLIKRHYTHNANLVGGQYNIPADYRAAKTEWVPDWGRRDALGVSFSEEAFVALIKEAFVFRNNLDIFLSPQNRGVDSTVQKSLVVLLKALEKNLLYDLRPAGTRSPHSPPSPRLTIVHHGDTRWLESVDIQYRAKVKVS